MLAAVLITVTTARPEAGYSYNPPISNYNLPNHYGVPGEIGGTFITGTSNVGGFNTGVHGISGIYTGGHGNSGTVSTGSRITTGGQTTPGVNKGGLIHKHIYVHVAPPELELQQQQEIKVTSAPQKHYKIIFIKTPTQSTSSVQQIQTQAQNQEKTLIYVLVKRPDDTPNIALTSPTPTKPSKPEVYFIRYKTSKETTGKLTSKTLGAGGPGLGGQGPPNNNTRPSRPPAGGGGGSTGVSSGGAGAISGGTVSGGSASGAFLPPIGKEGPPDTNSRLMPVGPPAGGGGGFGGYTNRQQSYGPPDQSGPYYY